MLSYTEGGRREEEAQKNTERRFADSLSKSSQSSVFVFHQSQEPGVLAGSPPCAQGPICYFPRSIGRVDSEAVCQESSQFHTGCQNYRQWFTALNDNATLYI